MSGKRGGQSLHAFIMREAASTGQRKLDPKLSKTQLDAMALAKDGHIRADLMQIHPRTWASLRDRGLMTIDRVGNGLRYASLTPAGRSALISAKGA